MKNSLLKRSLLFFALLMSSGINAQEFTLITENAPPNSFIENGRLTGRAVEIIQAVLNETGMVGHEIKMYPWARGYRMLETRKNIALFSTSRTQFRENRFKWAGPIADNEVNLYKLKSRQDIQPKTLDELKKYRVGSGRNDQKTQYLQANGFELELVDEDRQNVDKLFAGRVDVIPYAAARLSYDLKRFGFDPGKIEIIWNVKEISTQIYVAFSNSTDDRIVERFQKGFDTIKKNGIHEEILKKWK